jgi:hypothetical protein
MREAEELYSTFTQYPVDRYTKISLPWSAPEDLYLIGEGLDISYVSDKYEDGVIDYIHPFETEPILVMGPAPAAGYPQAPLYIDRPPGGKIGMMGRDFSHCLDIRLVDAKSGKVDLLDFAKFPTYPFIGSHPDGHTILVFYPGLEPILVHGPGLQITERGIVG